jgi:energy-coupling factor transporter ATP-binding protein EcfA2
VVSAGFRHYRFLVELRDRHVLDLSGGSDRRVAIAPSFGLDTVQER